MQKECHPTDQLGEEKVVRLIKSVKKQFKQESPLLNLSGSYVVVGDIHGNIQFLTRLFQTLHYPSETLNSSVSSTENSNAELNPTGTKYLFLGDYIDRGSNSLEVLLLLYALKLRFPHHIYLLRGNHETNQFKKNSSFRSECLLYLNEHIYKYFLSSFSYMPLCANVNGVLCLHGGISPSLYNLEDIKKLPFPIVDLNGTPAADILWSDPDPSVDYYQDSPRGFGYLFGQDSLGLFLEDNGLKCLIRGHQFCPSGFSWTFGTDCLTISSSTDYNGTGSMAAVALIANDGTITTQTFPPLGPNNKFRVVLPDWLLSSPSKSSSREDLFDIENVVSITDILSL
jgi:diadenosine tetraphosphatase ApaH/serine/threonine PP2A family protein phosphatase